MSMLFVDLWCMWFQKILGKALHTLVLNESGLLTLPWLGNCVLTV